MAVRTPPRAPRGRCWPAGSDPRHRAGMRRSWSPSARRAGRPGRIPGAGRRAARSRSRTPRPPGA